MITFKFYVGFNKLNVRIIEVNSYKEFFDYYMENCSKGLIYDVKLNKGVI